ncbi:hypothetical protein [Streptomyces viridochromogenes]|uniref:Uncharacterized protein n=1 Tax=Streptomyces viridochromogenes Tue57 TaxID=1160705 RepID=L8P414_STRVR|nr:hypothetical protein [Streptomyces viridochromogenes]ELS50878.1 hypothetical protein STVIR_8153 [Streptomyces viridochromogenes Tue57]
MNRGPLVPGVPAVYARPGRGGFLSIGEKKSYIPLDAVASVRGDQVRADRAQEEVTGASEWLCPEK